MGFIAKVLTDIYRSFPNMFLMLLVAAIMSKLIMIIFSVKEARSFQIARHIKDLSSAIYENELDRHHVDRAVELQRFYGYNAINGTLPLLLQAVVVVLLYFVSVNHDVYLPDMNAPLFFSGVLNVNDAIREQFPPSLIALIIVGLSAFSSMTYYQFAKYLNYYSLVDLEKVRTFITGSILLVTLLSPMMVGVYVSLATVIDILFFVAMVRFFPTSENVFDQMDENFRAMAKKKYGNKAKFYIEALDKSVEKQKRAQRRKAREKAGGKANQANQARKNDSASQPKAAASGKDSKNNGKAKTESMAKPKGQAKDNTKDNSKDKASAKPMASTGAKQADKAKAKPEKPAEVTDLTAGDGNALQETQEAQATQASQDAQDVQNAIPVNATEQESGPETPESSISTESTTPDEPNGPNA